MSPHYSLAARPRWLGAIPSLFLLSAALLPAATQWLDQPDSAHAAAWVRFAHGGESYTGIPYYWLGRGGLRLEFAVPPQPGCALELRWGSKDDAREAILEINGHTIPLAGGGYRGFRWLRVPVPEGLPGDRHRLTLNAHKNAAFLAEIRLTSPATNTAPAALSQPAQKATILANEAFPALRTVWDRPSISLDLASPEDLRFRQAEQNARHANEAFYRCRRYMDAWLAEADPVSGLIPRNLTVSRDYWNGRDSGADNYPFMVLTAAMIDRPLLAGRLLTILRTEQRLTSRIDRLPDDYSFSKQGWRREKLDLDEIIFDGAEYVKDGLLPVTEWLGPSPWSERMTGIVDDIWKNARIDTPFGRIATLNFEVNGDLLQAGARLYWFTGDPKYLDWTLRLGDYYLLGTNHPTRHLKELRLRDHGCEVINGLTELYLAARSARPAKAAAYQPLLHEMFDRILEVGRNEHGLLYDWVQPQTGAHSRSLADTWGYDYDGFYTMYLLDHTIVYRDATRKALGNLDAFYRNYPWEGESADGYADSIEGGINLFNREPILPAAVWIDSEMRVMWSKQKSNGIIEGWHGDGNFARTSLMYALWKTQGITIDPWRLDVRFGAVRDPDGSLRLFLAADQPWEGRLVFDRARHRDYLHLPLDYPRINQFPEWFTIAPEARFAIQALPGGTETIHGGHDLLTGLPVRVKAGESIGWTIKIRPAKD